MQKVKVHAIVEKIAGVNGPLVPPIFHAGTNQSDILIVPI